MKNFPQIEIATFDPGRLVRLLLSNTYFGVIIFPAPFTLIVRTHTSRQGPDNKNPTIHTHKTVIYTHTSDLNNGRIRRGISQKSGAEKRAQYETKLI